LRVWRHVNSYRPKPRNTLISTGFRKYSNAPAHKKGRATPAPKVPSVRLTAAAVHKKGRRCLSTPPPQPPSCCRSSASPEREVLVSDAQCPQPADALLDRGVGLEQGGHPASAEGRDVEQRLDGGVDLLRHRRRP